MAYKKHSRAASGFTLIELSVSILIISLILASVVTVEAQKGRVEKKAELARKLDMISEALYTYRLVNNKLPCPGNASLARTAANFGVQADGAPGECNSGATISSNINSTDLGVSVFGGSVPVRTLGLPDDFAFDPWDGQFTYYVDKNANVSDNFTSSAGTDGFTDTDILNVEDESGSPLNDNVLAVVLSHGPNGHGSFNIAGVRTSSESLNVAELENCMCDSDAVAVADTARNIRIQRTLPSSSTDYRTNFDDVARYFNKSYFYTYAEKYP